MNIWQNCFVKTFKLAGLLMFWFGFIFLYFLFFFQNILSLSFLQNLAFSVYNFVTDLCIESLLVIIVLRLCHFI